MTWLWLLLPGALLVMLAVLVLRAALFAPRETPAPDATPARVEEEKAIDDLRRMVCCRTVSRAGLPPEEPEEFEKFRALLPELYPRVHEACACTRVGDSGLLYLWKGKSNKAPSVMMAHYDVVSVDENGWEKPPFAGIIEDGVLWGRGTLDTKGTLCGILEAAEHLLQAGFVPENDVYFSFAGDEEVAGATAPAIVEELRKRGVRPALVVDEGGAVVRNVFPGVSRECALVGIGEKGMVNMEFAIKSAGGHASAPPAHTPVGVLSEACARVEAHPFAQRITPPAAEMFGTLGRYSTFAYRLIFSNLWLFKPVLNAMSRKKGGELNAMMRTTCAFTMMEGSRGMNVLPPTARMVANMRLIGGDTPESAKAYLEKTIGNADVQLTVLTGMNPSPFSPTKGPAWEKVKSAIRQTWPEAIVSPYLMVACSDSRHFCRISDYVYRFSAMALTAEERATIHGNNERVPTEKIVRCAQFYARLISQL